MAGEHDDGQIGKAPVDRLQEFEAVHDGHLEVGDNQVHLCFFNLFQRLPSVGCRVDAVSFELQEVLNDKDRFLVVIYNEDIGLVLGIHGSS